MDLFHHFAASCTERVFFGLPTWHKYLEKKDVGGVCEIQFDLMEGGKFNGDDMLLIALSIVDILVWLAGIIAVFFVMYGGIKYITSQGSPDGTKGAQNTIMNALIGLGIAIVAGAVVGFIGNMLAK